MAEKAEWRNAQHTVGWSSLRQPTKMNYLALAVKPGAEAQVSLYCFTPA